MHASVVIIGPAYPLRGGLASFNERLARQFIAEGDEVALWTFSLQYPSFLFPGKTQYSSDPQPEGLNIQVRINSVSPLNWVRTGLALKKHKPDILVVRYWLPFMGPCLGTILRLVRSNHHTRIICIADNIIPHEKRFGDQVWTTYFMKPVQAVITMSEQVEQDLVTHYNKPHLRVTHPLYDLFGEPADQTEARNRLQIPVDGNLLLFFGFIRKYKGLDLLLEAMYRLKQNGFLSQHTLRVLIAGECYEDIAPYHDLIRTYALEPYIVLHTDFIPDSQVRWYLSAADAVIQPYRHATQSGVTPLAYHFEKPMLVTRVGSLPDFVPAGVGLIVEPNAEAIAKGIQDLMAEDLGKMQTAIREEKKKYHWQHLTSAIRHLAMGEGKTSGKI